MVTPEQRQRDVIWIQKNRHFLWANYAGKWIAVQDETLIASGDSSGEALEEAKAKGFPSPLVTGVRKRELQGVKFIRRT